jgi:hypothetical protein
VPGRWTGYSAFRVATAALTVSFALTGFYASARSADAPVTQQPASMLPQGSANDAAAVVVTDVPMRGLVYAGLKRSNTNGRCRNAFHGRTADGKKICTHGPDAAPQGVDVRMKPQIDELKASTAQPASSTSTHALPCYGDGQSGPRVQAIYARASDVPDRSAEIASLIPSWAANADAAFNGSAVQTGGIRHVLWATTSNCSLVVDSVELSESGDDSLTNTITELKAMGYTRTDRKYLVWADATRYCGIAQMRPDDQPGAANANNFGPTFARVDSACWGLSNSSEAHELMHTFGGIQPSAPHASGGWHCTDENDRMCLNDGMSKSLTYTCPESNEAFFDCGHDDYFSTASSPATYLTTHWNTANSIFLAAAVPDACQSQGSSSELTAERRHRRHRQHRKTPVAENMAAAPCSPLQAFPAT